MNESITRDDLRSDEEMAMVLWLREATEHGLVLAWAYEPKKISMFCGRDFKETIENKKTDTLTYKKRMLHPSEGYTPDFKITFTDMGWDMIHKSLLKACSKPLMARTIYIDTKGTYAQHGSAHFGLVQKVIYAKYGFFVEKVIPFYKTKKAKKAKGLFVDTFAPEELRWMKPGARKVPTLNDCGNYCIGIKEFMEGN